jgi:hypothetical protein
LIVARFRLGKSLSSWACCLEQNGISMRHGILKSLGPAAVAALLVGCGGGVSLETVAGKVTLDGAPLPGATLMLVSTNAPTTADADPNVKGPFLGKTDDQGQFEMGPISNPGGGVPAGAYTLTIKTAHVESADETTVAPPERVPPPHSTTGVDFEVPDGGTSDANFEFKSK